MAVAVKGNRYWAMLSEFSKELKMRILATFDAMCPTAEATLVVFRPVFEDFKIGTRADIALSLRKCDLTSLHYDLLDVFKDKCYVEKPETIDALKDNIRKAISEIQLHKIDNVLKNWTDNVRYCMAS